MLEELNKNFPELAGAKPGLDCFKNAVLNAALEIYVGEKPKIYDVNTPVGRHAYLGNEKGEIMSQGITWKTDFYPELTIEDIKKLNGTDITKEILSEALNKTEDMYGYHRVLDNLAKDIPDIKKHISQFIESI